MSEFPDYLDVDYTDGEGESPADYETLGTKIEKAVAVTRTALEQYENPAVMWTGGKDSTLTLYFVLEVAEEYGYELPPAVFIDHFQHFDAVHDFVERWAEEWGVELVYARNDDVGALADEPGEEIRVDDLNERNRREVREKLEYEEETFPFLLDTYVGNHLLKTVALNDAIEARGIDGIISGVRWDEQEARADETFFSPRHDPETYPPHDRVHPILQFEERDVWDAFWGYVVPDTVEGYPEGHVPQSDDDLPDGLTQEDIPVSPKYFAGFRSLGSEVSTERADEAPAWLQDLEDTVERAGRAQDKEDLMERLRDLGYM
jgi:phosphoadenosine phosphosulfate reductase